MSRSAVVALLAAIMIATGAQAERIPPRDECSSSPSFSKFYGEFRSIVARRDARALIALIPAKDANMDFGGSDRGQFVEMWHLNRGVESELWPVLERTLRLGCARSGASFISPFFFNHLDPDPNSEPGDALVTDGKIALREKPHSSSMVVAMLDWDVVHVDFSRKSAKGWLAVTDDSNRRGYITAGSAFGGLDYRAVFEKVDGKWAFVFFGAGD